MNRIFIDTSAIFALLVPSDHAHRRARRVFDRLQHQEAILVTTSYNLLETYALIGRRFGLDLVRAFRQDFAPLLEVLWVDRDLHERALDRLLKLGKPQVSLVDVTSFFVINDEKVDRVFAFDQHFEDEGFSLLS